MRALTHETEVEESVLTTRQGTIGGAGLAQGHRATLLPVGRPGGRRMERGHREGGRANGWTQGECPAVPHPPRSCVAPGHFNPSLGGRGAGR